MKASKASVAEASRRRPSGRRKRSRGHSRSPAAADVPAYTRAPCWNRFARRSSAVAARSRRARSSAPTIERVVLERPPKLALGDLACPVAFDLAKTLRKAPRAIAAELAAGRPASRPACGRPGSRAAATSTSSSTAARSSARSLGGTRRRAGRGAGRSSSSTPTSTRTRRPTSATCATPSSATSSCARCGTSGHPVEVQNYLDDTGVQVADVVAGLAAPRRASTTARGRPGGSIRESRFPGGAVQPQGLRLPLLGPVRRGRPHLRGAARDEGLAGRGAPRDRGRATTRPRGSRRPWSRPSPRRTWRRWAASASRTTCCPARATSCTSTSGRAPSSCSRAPGAIHLETEGKHAGCWVLRLTESDEFAGHGGARQDPRPLQRHRHLHRQGHRVPALEVRPAADRLRLRASSSPVWNSGLGARGGDPGRRSAAHPLWRTAHAGGAAGAPAFGHATRVYNVIDVRQSYPQKVVREGLRALGHDRGGGRARSTSPTRSWRSRRRPRASSPSGSARSTAFRPRTRRSPSSRCRAARASGVKADDLVELLLERSRAEIAARRGGAEGGAAAADARRPRDRDRRAAVLPAEGRAQQDHRVRLRRGPQLRGRHGAVPPVLAGPRRQHLPQARGQGHRRLRRPRRRCRTRAGTTTSGRSPSTPPRPRTSPSAPSSRSSSRRLRATPSASPRASTTSTTASRSLQEPDAADPEPPARDRAYFPQRRCRGLLEPLGIPSSRETRM